MRLFGFWAEKMFLALSLLLLTLMVVVYVRSYWRGDALAYRWERHDRPEMGHDPWVVMAKSGYGHLELVVTSGTAPQVWRRDEARRVLGPVFFYANGWYHHCLGFGVAWYFSGSVRSWNKVRLGFLEVIFPDWVICVILTFPPARLLRRMLHRTPTPGYCPCGYNLYGNVSGVCPECGAPIAESEKASGAASAVAAQSRLLPIGKRET